MKYSMYDGEDRLKQINSLRELAVDMVNNTAISLHRGESMSVAEEIVDFCLRDIILPNWFSEYDQELLVEFMDG